MKRSHVAIIVFLTSIGTVAAFHEDIGKAFHDDVHDVHVSLHLKSEDPCDEQHPILMSVQNSSDRTIKSIWCDINVYERGNSDAVGIAEGDWTLIVQPHQTREACMAVNWKRRMTRDAPLTLTDEHLRVTFYNSGDKIPK